MARLAMKGRRLEFGIESDVASGAAVETLDELDELLERRHAQDHRVPWEAPREDRRARLQVIALVHMELPHFGKREIDRIPTAIRAFLPGENARNVGRRFEVYV